MEKKRTNRGYSLLTALLVIVVGVLLLIWPGKMIITFTKVIGGAVGVIGLLQLIRSLTDEIRNPLKTSFAVCILVFGVWVFAFPDAVTRFIPIMLGILLIVHGVDTIFTAISAKQFEYERWIPLFVLGVLTVLGGGACIVLSDWIRNAGMILLGIVLIYDGISSLFVTGKVYKVEKDYIDADFREIDDDDE